MAEHEALGAVDGVKADRGKEQAERAGHEALDDGFTRNAGDDRKAEDTEPELFRRHEFQRELGKQRGEEIQGNAAEQAAPEGAPAGRGERLARLTLQRHLVPLYRRCRRRRGAGRVDEDGGDGAAEDRTAVDSAQHDQSRFRGHGKGHGQ